jgi:hypothetical protein
MMVVAALFVIVSFMFWYQTWFGRQLRDNEVEQYLSDTKAPRKTQHALSQVSDLIIRGDARAKQWYPKIIALTNDPTPQVRMTAAWVMGQDNRAPEFHEALLRSLNDANPLVRDNSALSLARFADAASRPQLLAMLKSYSLRAERDGAISFLVQGEETIAVEKLLARITSVKGEVFEVRAPLPGYIKSFKVKEGANVAVGDELAQISPDQNQVWEALRALYIVGEKEDLPEIEAYAHNLANMSDNIRQQASLTAEAIRQRPEKSSESKSQP